MVNQAKNRAVLKRLEEAERAILGLGTLPDESLEVVARELKVELLDTYTKERDPYGRRWAKRKVDGDGHPLLDDTGRMKDSFVLRVRRQGVTMTNEATYAKFHQYGTKKMPARPVLPSEKDLPPDHMDVFKRNLEKHWEQTLTRVGFKKV